VSPPDSDPNTDPEVAAASAISEALPEHYFELYKLAVEMADRVSARRTTANAFFLTINTGLVALVGGTSLRWYVAAAGVVFSAAWWLLLKSYRKLNEAKFSVIVDMEERLPRQMFAEEYRHYKGSGDVPSSEAQVLPEARRARLAAWATRYRELGEVERIVPAIFALIYFCELLRQASR
jgi:hypothetical protein